MQGIDHYENFPVASWLCPAHLRPAIVALYHFARTADDLADEGDVPAPLRLQQLQQYRTDLHTCLQVAQQMRQRTGLANTPSPQPEPAPANRAEFSTAWPQVFHPLARIQAQHDFPPQWLFDLLDAFEQDVAFTRDGVGYATQAELLDYCRRSANPVGRLLLHLYGVHHAEALQQSDAICTALQLINFWQDRLQDAARGRNYLPRNSSWDEQLVLARERMQAGAGLVHQVKGRAGWELRLVVQGGLRILRKLEQRHAQQDPLLQPNNFKRPKLGAFDVGIMLWHALWM